MSVYEHFTSLHCVRVFFHENDLIENLASIVAGLISTNKYLKHNLRDFILFSNSEGRNFSCLTPFCEILFVEIMLAIIPCGKRYIFFKFKLQTFHDALNYV